MYVKKQFPAPARATVGPVPPEGVDTWFELWRPYPDDYRGDLVHSLMIGERELRKGALGEGVTLSWQ